MTDRTYTAAEVEALLAKTRDAAARAANDRAHWDECPEWLLSGIDAYRQRVVYAVRTIDPRKIMEDQG